MSFLFPFRTTPKRVSSIKKTHTHTTHNVRGSQRAESTRYRHRPKERIIRVLDVVVNELAILRACSVSLLAVSRSMENQGSLGEGWVFLEYGTNK